jgi:hypothetical protein
MQKQTRQQSLQVIATESETRKTALAPHVFENRTYLPMNVCTQIHIVSVLSRTSLAKLLVAATSLEMG